METVDALLNIARLYGIIGAVTALIFVTVGVGRLDDGARGLRPLFRLILIPGATVLWPLTAWRMLKSFRGQG
ncbi:MAG: hypothetical protein V3U67_06740 [Gemmatimonadota bacterium]